jgi:hypothetical protein
MINFDNDDDSDNDNDVIQKKQNQDSNIIEIKERINRNHDDIQIQMTEEIDKQISVLFFINSLYNDNCKSYRNEIIKILWEDNVKKLKCILSSNIQFAKNSISNLFSWIIKIPREEPKRIRCIIFLIKLLLNQGAFALPPLIEYECGMEALENECGNDDDDDEIIKDEEEEEEGKEKRPPAKYLSNLIFILIKVDYYPLERALSKFKINWLLNVYENNIADFNILIDKYGLLNYVEFLGMIDKQIVLSLNTINQLQKEQDEYKPSFYDAYYGNRIVDNDDAIEKLQNKLKKYEKVSKILAKSLIEKFIYYDLSCIILEYF